MRLAMGTTTYWSIFAVLFLLTAICIKFKRDALGDKGKFSSEYRRMQKSSPINHAARTLVLQPEDALSSNYGDS